MLHELDSLSSALTRAGRIQEAESLLVAALPRWIGAYATRRDSSDAARLLGRHAFARYRAADYQTAATLYAAALPLLPALVDSAGRPDSVLMVRMYRWQATCLLYTSDGAGALKALDSAEDAARRFGLFDQLRQIYRSKSNIIHYYDSTGAPLRLPGLPVRSEPPAPPRSLFTVIATAVLVTALRLGVRRWRRKRETVAA